jgi:hypothetical protein
VTAVSGTVSLEFWTASAENIPVTVEIRQGNLTVQTTTVNLASNGGYTVPLLQPLDYGTYDVTIKASHWLRVLGQGITVPGGTFDAELKNGDATNDNVVDVQDLNYVLVRFATTDPTADLDGSGLVDLPDISIVLLNFTMQGVPPANNGAAAPSLDGLSGNGRNLLFLDLGQGGNPYAPYRVYRKAGGGNYSFVGETPMRLFLDTSATNGTAYTYKACVLNASGGEAAFSPEVVLTPTADNPTCTATVTSEGGTSAAYGAAWANLSAWSDGVEAMALCLDGEYVDYSGNAQPSLSYDSECGRNGLRAAVVVVWDDEERYGFSNITPMTFVNEFSLKSLTTYELNPWSYPPETTAFACRLKSPEDYRVELVDMDALNVVRTWESTAPAVVVACEWDGTNAIGDPVDDSTYAFIVTLRNKVPPVPPSAPESLEACSVTEPRAVIVNTFLHEGVGGDPALRGYEFVRHIRQACNRAGISVKVFNPGNAYWEDYGPDNRYQGVASLLESDRLRMFFFLGHGTHNVTLQSPNDLTSFKIRKRPPPPGTERPVAPAWGWMAVRKPDLQQLTIEAGKLRLVWIHTCGSGRYKGRVAVDYLKDPDAWRNVIPHEMNDLAEGFGIQRPEYRLDPSFYMGFYGYAYARDSHPTYLNMVQAFFERFSLPDGYGGTLYTIGEVLSWLNVQSEHDVRSEFPGRPPTIVWDDPRLWLKNSPPYYNIRVFSDTDRGTGPYYGDFKMQHLRQ